MASKRKSNPANSSSKLNFRPTLDKNEPKGTKPTANQFSVRNVLLTMIQHCCRRLLFFDIKHRVFFYLGFVFFFSILVDVLPLPKSLQTSLSVSKDNFFNQYFVKVGWGWTLLLGLPFCGLTSFIYCCGKRENVIKNLSRFLIATFFWLFWTQAFVYVESLLGKCNIRDSRLQNKSACLSKGYFWHSIDISGHCFILLYSTLMLIEECRVINCWEGIADIIREENYARTVERSLDAPSQLKALSEDEFEKLKAAYPKLTPFIRTLFILITILIIIWDMMLITTVIFYHNMIEKLIAAFAAIATWYFTYYIWFFYPNIFPPSPGEGLFKYRTDVKQQLPPSRKKCSSNSNKVPSQKSQPMGMPSRVPEEPRASRQEEVSLS